MVSYTIATEIDEQDGIRPSVKSRRKTVIAGRTKNVARGGRGRGADAGRGSGFEFDGDERDTDIAVGDELSIPTRTSR